MSTATPIANANGSRHLTVFTKYWIPGSVKTRLARRLGDPVAADIHRLFLTSLLRRLANSGDRRTIAVAPHGYSHDLAKVAGARWNVVDQSPGDLGQRLDQFCRAEFAQGCQRLVIIGADSPQLDPPTIDQAFESLRSHEVVLGECFDGGYYLLGLRRYLPIFESIDWGTARVFRQTVQRIQNLNGSLFELPIDGDVDEYEDLLWLRKRLERRGVQDEDARQLASEIRQRLESEAK